MEVTITQFRKQIFELASQALDGKNVSFTHKGKRLRIVPEEKPGSKLARLTPMRVFNPDYIEAGTSLLQEMEMEWEKDWADL